MEVKLNTKSNILTIHSNDMTSDFREMLWFNRGVWNKKREVWLAPFSPRLINKLHKRGYKLCRETRRAYKVYRNLQVPDYLYPFQKTGVKRLEYFGGVALLADEMGLGKTIQLLTWISEANKVPAVIVCPAYLRLNWVKETIKWTNLTYQIITTGKDVLKIVDIYIISYSLLPTYVDWFIKLKPKAIAADEAHYLKTPRVARSKAFKKLARKVPSRVLMTGTPFTNRTYELWNLLTILNYKAWPAQKVFGRTYCDPRKSRAGFTEFKGVSNVVELRKKLKQTGYLRRTKKQHLKDLPDKVRQIMPIEISNKSEYKKAEKDILAYFKGKDLDDRAERAKRAKHITQLTELKKLAGMGKLEGVEKFVKDLIADGERPIVFGIHKAVLETLHSKFVKGGYKVGIITGKTSASKRNALIEAFQNSELDALFGNVDSMGTGLTLTVSKCVVFIEYPWEPAKVDQAEDRAHRIGQLDCVVIYYCVGFGTIDEKMVDLIDAKRLQFRMVIDDGKIVAMDNIISELVKQYSGGVLR